MKIYNKFEEIHIGQWDKLLNHSSTATFFQTPECYDFYASLSFLKPFVYAVAQDDKLLALAAGYILADGGLLKQSFSRRAIINGGILLAENVPDSAVDVLLATIKNDLGKKTVYIEIRNNTDYSAYKKDFEKQAFLYQAHLNYEIALTTKQDVFDKLSKSKKRQIKQAQKQGVTYETVTEKHEVEIFYSLLKNLYEKKVKRPLFPLEFFQKLVKLPNGRLFVVKRADKIIGGIACVIFEKKTAYEWFVCGDDRNDKKSYPSVMATWAGIEYACDEGIESFDFMGAGKPDKAYGVREFKSKFGGRMLEYGRFLYISKPLKYKLGKFALYFLKSIKK